MPITPLFDPDSFFRERDPGLLVPALVVLLVGAANVSRGVPDVLGSQPGVPPTVVAAAVLLGGIVGGSLAWVAVAAVVHLVSALYGGEGGFGRTFAFVGWGFLPGVVSGLSAAAVAVAFANPPGWAALASALVGVAVALWQGYLWAYATVHARRVGRAAGFATAAVPVVGSILLTATGLLA